MSPAFESSLAKLYVDRTARRQFLADPGGEAAAAGLSDDEIAAAIRIDRFGLELAAASWGWMIEGHGGVLDRLDSVAFAAPVFFT